MTFFQIDTTPEQVDYTCADLTRRAVYVDSPGMAQALIHDAVNMIRSLQAELDRARAAAQLGALTWACEICSRTHSRAITPGAVVPRYCQPDQPGDPPTSCQVAAKAKQDARTAAERTRRSRAKAKAKERRF